MGVGYRVEEEYYEDFRRAILVESGGVRVYSIDVYRRVPPGVLECSEILDAGAPARLCYSKLSDNCEAVVVEVPGEGLREVVNLRAVAPAEGDPFKGSIGEARGYCFKMLERVLGGGLRVGEAGEDKGSTEDWGGGQG